jgi:type II secretory pathway pseudopilin PulG
MTTKHKTQKGAETAFSFMEMLIAIAIISTLASIGFFAISGVHQSSKETRLVTHVKTLNTSLRIFEANGGNLSDLKDPNEIIGRLKQGSSNAKEIAGIRGAVIDNRLDIKLTSSDKGNRAVWDSDTRRFLIRSEGHGVAEFYLNDELGEKDFGTDKRNVNLELAKVDSWIWDYKDYDVANGTPGNNLGGSNTGTAPPPVGGELTPPEFSIQGGVFALSAFDLSLTLRDMNETGLAMVKYSVNDGEWAYYDGGEIVVTPDATVRVFAESLKSDLWRSSREVMEYYSVQSGNLEIAVNFSKSAYTYKELGGTMMVGTEGSNATMAPPGRISIANRSAIVDYLSTDTIAFRSRVGNGAEIVIPVDPNEYFGEIFITHNAFGASGNIIVEARALSNVLGNSATVAAALSAESLTLLNPEIEERPRPDGLFIYDEHYVDIVLKTESGDMPEGVRIYYTTDGSDPGDSGGMPISQTATLFEKPFLVSIADGTPIRARVYPPLAKEQWFMTSNEGKIVWPLVASIGFTMNSSTNPPELPSTGTPIGTPLQPITAGVSVTSF